MASVALCQLLFSKKRPRVFFGNPEQLSLGSFGTAQACTGIFENIVNFLSEKNAYNINLKMAVLLRKTNLFIVQTKIQNFDFFVDFESS